MKRRRRFGGGGVSWVDDSMDFMTCWVYDYYYYSRIAMFFFVSGEETVRNVNVKWKWSG